MQYHASCDRSSAMNRLVAALTGVCSLVAISSVSHAATITLDLATAIFTGGAGTIAGGSEIKFDPNTPGETATFTLLVCSGYAVRDPGDRTERSIQFVLPVRC
jgi:hypothetical protein